MKSIQSLALACLVISHLACSSKGSEDATSSGGSTTSGGSGSTTGGATSGGTTGGATTGGAGAGGTGGAVVMPLVEYAFAADLEEWGVLTGEGASAPETLVTDTVIEWTGDEGQPDVGAMKISVPFDGVDQSMAVQIELPEAMDFTDKKLSFRVLLESGLSEDPMTPGGVRAFTKGGEWIWAEGLWKNVGVDEIGTWLTVTLDFSDPAGSEPGYDAAIIRQLGIQVLTGSMGETYGPAVLYIDSIVVQ